MRNANIDKSIPLDKNVRSEDSAEESDDRATDEEQGREEEGNRKETEESMKRRRAEITTRTEQSDTYTTSPPDTPIRSYTRLLSCFDDSTKFAFRIAASASLASLFILLPDAARSTTSVGDGDDDEQQGQHEQPLPEALWIVITAVVVSWQASPDIASVSKKMIQRLVGTILGALAGLSLGGFSLLLEPGSTQQSMFLFFTLASGTFCWALLASKNGYRSHYSATLGCLTFGIVLLAFYDVNADDAWSIGAYRMLNICIGGLLGGTVSLVVFPMGTTTLIENKVAQLIHATGNTSRAVLAAASSPPPKLLFLARKQETEDESHQHYMNALAEWQKTRQLFDLLPYDPFFLKLSKEKQQLFWETFRLRLGRVLRIQVTLIMLDGLNRSRLHDVQENAVLERIGKRLQLLLATSEQEDNTDKNNDTECKDSARRGLVEEDLPIVRRFQSTPLRRISLSCTSPARTTETSSASFDENAACDGMASPSTNIFTELVPEAELRTDAEAAAVTVVLHGEELSRALDMFVDHDSILLQQDNAAIFGRQFFSTSQSTAFFFQLLEFVIVRALRLDRYCVLGDAKMNNTKSNT